MRYFLFTLVVMIYFFGTKATIAAAISPSINKTPAPTSAPAGMKWIPGGTFLMGCEKCNMEDAQPMHWVELSGYWIDEAPVTNFEFEKFVAATQYKTVAEKTPKAEDLPGVAKEDLNAGSAVFTPPKQAIKLQDPYAWWRYEKGASWKHPEGPKTNTKKRTDHPVVHVAYEDALAFCSWLKKTLPTEAEFEFAARGGHHQKDFAWGDQMKPNGKWVANIYQGHFPYKNTSDDGYTGTSPVKAFPPNDFGLYDMGGNVWQWVADWYRPDYYQTLVKKGVLTRDPTGPEDSLDPQEPGVKKRVQRSGSFLCSDQYCQRYFVGSRGKGATDSGSSNVGFRCAMGAKVAPKVKELETTGGSRSDLNKKSCHAEPPKFVRR